MAACNVQLMTIQNKHFTHKPADSALADSQFAFADDRSKQQKKEDAKKLAVHRKEDERLKAKERKWREEQRRLAQKRAEEEAEEVRMKLLKAQLGPTPTTAGNTCLPLLT